LNGEDIPLCVDRVGCVGRMCLWMAGGRTTRSLLVECGGAHDMRDFLDIFETKKWNKRLLRLIDSWKRAFETQNNKWDRKINSLQSCWNIWYYQIIGHMPTIFTPPIHSVLSNCA